MEFDHDLHAPWLHAGIRRALGLLPREVADIKSSRVAMNLIEIRLILTDDGCVRLLRDQEQAIQDAEQQPPSPAQPTEESPTLDDLGLDRRARKRLAELDVQRIEEISEITAAELLEGKGFGAASLTRLTRDLLKHGITLKHDDDDTDQERT